MEKNYRILLFNKSVIRNSLIIALFLSGESIAQVKRSEIKNSEKIYAIDFTQSFISDSLKLNKGENFYAFLSDTVSNKTKLSSKVYYYVYASSKTELKSVFGENAFKYFHHSDSLANVYADSLKKVGYDVMVYHTAATSGAKFNTRMLEYNPGTISFIMFHESIHRHKQNTESKLPYIFEEALGDVTGILFSSRAVNNKVDKKNHAKFIKVNEKIYKLVNKAIKGEVSKEKATKKLKQILKNGDTFQKDRFNYEINNAFLLRYTSYIKYYFLLKEVYSQFSDPYLFYIAMFKLSGIEEEVVKALNDFFALPTNNF